MDPDEQISCLYRDVMRCDSSPSFGKKLIFSISCLIAYFVVYQETLGDYKSVGRWVGRKEVAFVFSRNFHLRNKKKMSKSELPCAL